jgi:hypothetical protein
MLMRMLCLCRTSMKLAAVNYDPRSVLKISGAPYRLIASSSASTQKSAVMLLEIRQLKTRRLNQVSQQIRIDRMSRMPPARIGAPVNRFDAHFSHQGCNVLASDQDAFEAKHVAQHPAAQERPFQVQLIDATHELQIRLAGPYGLVVQRCTRELQQLSLTREAQIMVVVDHRLAPDPGARPSAPAKTIWSSLIS